MIITPVCGRLMDGQRGYQVSLDFNPNLQLKASLISSQRTPKHGNSAYAVEHFDGGEEGKVHAREDQHAACHVLRV